MTYNPQSCQAHSCSLFFSLKVWSMSHSYSSTVRAVTDLMCCRKASRLCLGCGKETHTLAGGKRLVCCFVCVCVCVCVCFVEHLMCDKRLCLWMQLQGKKQVSRPERVIFGEADLWRRREHASSVHSDFTSVPLFTQKWEKKRVFLGGVFPLSVSFLLHKG